MAPTQQSSNGPSAYDIAGVAMGVVGTVGIIALLKNTVEKYLPAQQMKLLDDVVDDTLEIFNKVVADGLLRDALQFKNDTEEDLAK